MKRRLYVLRRELEAFVLRRDEALLLREVAKTEYLVAVRPGPVQKALFDGRRQCPGNPEKRRRFRTLEASLSVGFQA